MGAVQAFLLYSGVGGEGSLVQRELSAKLTEGLLCSAMGVNNLYLFDILEFVLLLLYVFW